MVLFTQLNEPLAFYMRYYARFEPENGTGIRSVPRNLQSSFLLSPVRVLGPGLISGRTHTAAVRPEGLNEADTKQVAELLGLLRGLDLVCRRSAELSTGCTYFISVPHLCLCASHFVVSSCRWV